MFNGGYTRLHFMEDLGLVAREDGLEGLGAMMNNIGARDGLWFGMRLGRLFELQTAAHLKRTPGLRLDGRRVARIVSLDTRTKKLDFASSAGSGSATTDFDIIVELEDGDRGLIQVVRNILAKDVDAIQTWDTKAASFASLPENQLPDGRAWRRLWLCSNPEALRQGTREYEYFFDEDDIQRANVGIFVQTAIPITR